VDNRGQPLGWDHVATVPGIIAEYAHDVDDTCIVGGASYRGGEHGLLWCDLPAEPRSSSDSGLGGSSAGRTAPGEHTVHKATLHGCTAPLSCVKFIGDGHHLATASRDGLIAVWHFAPADRVRMLEHRRTNTGNAKGGVQFGAWLWLLFF
jgi:WD40 repeat protein